MVDRSSQLVSSIDWLNIDANVCASVRDHNVVLTFIA